jgi:methylated-DNA-[protein]-cysteine S-methyltransferase
MNLSLARLPSPIGTILLAFDGEAVRGLEFSDSEARLHRALRLHYGLYALSEAGDCPFAAPIAAYFDGDLAALDGIPVATRGTAFQRQVWAALREIPFGTTTSYGSLAAQIGRPKAVRAVGLANGANPVALIVPCHRVIGSDGSLTGYGGGLPRKEWLLRHEGGMPTLAFTTPLGFAAAAQ